MKVAFLELPFSYYNAPSLSFPLLKQCLSNVGIDSDIYYFSVDFARIISGETYNYICHHEKKLQDWFVSELAFQKKPENILDHINKIDEKIKIDVLKYTLEKFIIRISKMPWDKYDVVGFTGIMGQLTTSIALGRLIKQKYSNVLVFYGGPYFWNDSGEEFMKMPHIDVAFLGEAEISLPQLCKRLETMSLSEAAKSVPGIAYRSNNQVYVNKNVTLPQYEHIPEPDYSDYEVKKSKHANIFNIPIFYHLDITRGCVYGKCTFCDEPVHNRRTTRKRTPQQSLKYLYHMYTRYKDIDEFMVNSPLVSNQDIKQVWKPWATKKPRKVSLGIESQPNLRKEEIKILRDAGVTHIQAGIETLIPECSKLMNKVQTVPQSIAFLKWCKYYGILVKWLWLFGIPGQKTIWYNDDVIQLIYNCMHFEPPMGVSNIAGNKGTTYMVEPNKWGITNIKPSGSIPPILPEYLDKNKIVCDFDLEFPEKTSAAQDNIANIIMNKWREPYIEYRNSLNCNDHHTKIVSSFTYRQLKLGDGYIYDSRLVPFCQPQKIEIDDIDRQILMFTDGPKSKHAIAKNVPRAISHLDDLIDKNLLYCHKGIYISFVESYNDE